ncbi:urea transporter [Pseudomonas sp. LP_7_YM]|uniref:urea transporter n=1 Tax=Pseudomonas sp. LP_7_YM TaxID=2485137 RepID=UPI00105F5328|nr:urea transporter [Pseudomonas sp. LP_7_YM]TDV67941.1 urea transporter [Pseudomonas sp. LP_7_YM]
MSFLRPPPASYCQDWPEALLNGFSQVLLQLSPLCGLFCLLAILISAPASLGGALLGAVSGLLTAQRRGYPKAERQSGVYSYNGVLLGLLICYRFEWSPLLPLLIIACSGLSAMLMHAWLQRTPGVSCLNAYTAPFVLFSWVLLIFAAPLPGMRVADGDLIQALSLGLGQVFLLDHPLAGVLIGIGLLLANRTAALWAAVGCASGVAFALWQQENNLALLGLSGYNPALAALAFSHARYKPWLPGIAIVLAIILQPGFAELGLATLTAPFILACWLVQAGDRLLQQSINDQRLRS